MNQTESLRPKLDRLQQRALIIGVVGLALCVVGAFIGSTEQFFRSYLFGYIFWVGLSIGSLGVLMLHNLVGGPWGWLIRRTLESGAKNLLLMAILFIPIVFGLHSIYEWTHTEVVNADPILLHKSLYLNEGGFILRAVIYFVLWTGIAFMLNRSLRRLEGLGGVGITRGVQNFSAVSLLLFFLTVTFAAFDWMMSLEPHWFSTVYGMLFVVGQVLSTFAFSVLVLMMLANANPELKAMIKTNYLHDLGNFLLAFTMLWTYISISQYLIIWSANLPEEVIWYLPRINGLGQVLSAILLLFHFAAPFFLLLMRKNKRHAKNIVRVAVLLMVMRLVDLFWTLNPGLHHGHFHFHWLDLAAPIGIGGIWLAVFFWQLKKVPSLVPANAPLNQGGHHGH